MSPGQPTDDAFPPPQPTNLVDGLHQQYAAAIAAFLRGLLRDPERAQEALQNTFLAAVKEGPRLRAETAKAWLFQVAYNEAQRLNRRAGLEQRGQTRLRDLARETDWPRSADDSLVNAETAAAVRQAVNELPLDLRRVVELRVDDGLTFAEIAAALGIPLGTALTRMRNALIRLREVDGIR